jgi:hypothetical protein
MPGARGHRREIRDLDIEALVPEVAFALGDRERQVVEKGLAADRDRDLRLLGLLRPRVRRDERPSASASAAIACMKRFIPVSSL